MADQMSRKPEARVSVSVRLRPEVAALMKSFVRDHAGKPLFLTLSTFTEAAIERHVAHLSAELEGRTTSHRHNSSSPNHRR